MTQNKGVISLKNQPIIKTSVLNRDIVNTLVTDTKNEWLSELETLESQTPNKESEVLSLILEGKSFIDHSTDSDRFETIAPNGELGIELRNHNGEIYGLLWSNQSNDYDCTIEKVF